MTNSHGKKWVEYNPNTATYDTPDGTSLACEVADNADCLADLLVIAEMRHQQRSSRSKAPHLVPIQVADIK